MAQQPRIPVFPYVVSHSSDGLEDETASARFRLLEDAREYIDWKATSAPRRVWQVRQFRRPGTLYSAGRPE